VPAIGIDTSTNRVPQGYQQRVDGQHSFRWLHLT
jgi:hypothetical protein